MSVCEINLDKLLEWKDWCLSHEITYEEALLIFEGKALPVGDRPGYTLYLPIGFKYVFTIENTPSIDRSSIYKVRKLSGSLNKPDKYPTIELMTFISEKLGFSRLDKHNIRIKDRDPIPNIEISEVINVISI
jgi:hypothetical protein